VCVCFPVLLVLAGLELSQDPRELYVLKTTKWKLPPRLVLNARRPGFDLQEGAHQPEADPQQRPPRRQEEPWELSARALRSAFKVHAELGNKGLVRKKINSRGGVRATQVHFLDLASTFRRVDLSSLDLKSAEALCFFGNLYHLVVRHMLLVLGPPSSAKVGAIIERSMDRRP